MCPLSALHWLYQHYSRGWRHFCSWQSAWKRGRTLERTNTGNCGKRWSLFTCPPPRYSHFSLGGESRGFSTNTAAPTPFIFDFVSSPPCLGALLSAESPLDSENRAIITPLTGRQSAATEPEPLEKCHVGSRVAITASSWTKWARAVQPPPFKSHFVSSLNALRVDCPGVFADCSRSNVASDKEISRRERFATRSSPRKTREAATPR